MFIFVPFTWLHHAQRGKTCWDKKQRNYDDEHKSRSIHDVYPINRCEGGKNSRGRKHKWQSGKNGKKKLLICLYIRSRLFPFSVTAILQITFRKHNPSGEKESAIKKVGKFHQEARSVLLVKSILIIDELSITEYKNVSSTFFCLLYSPVGRCFATYRVFGGEVIKK